MIYLLEDDDSIRELVIYTLTSQGMEAAGFSHPSEFWEAMRSAPPSLLLLDIMLPEEDAIHILKKLRSSPSTKRLPIIMLTAKGSEYDTVLGLDSGADDYIPKPFRMMELLSRIRALLRRSSEEPSPTEYRLGKLMVNPQKHVDVYKRQILSKRPEECMMIGNDVSEDMVAADMGMEFYLVDTCLLNSKNRDVNGVRRGSLRDLYSFLSSLPAREANM